MAAPVAEAGATADRKALLARLRERKRFRVLIVGAGINGLGLFRELALQGVDCLIADRGDFCGGASAAPSRMIHGGLKYLENGEFRLVREATTERNRLLRNAPHLVHPLETVIPLPGYVGGIGATLARFLGRSAKPAARGLALTAIGLALYDFLGRHERQMPRHRLLGQSGLRQLVPGIDRRFVAGAVYYDAAITQAERLGVELALDGMAAEPTCIALNHAALGAMAGSRVVLRDTLSGERLEVEPDLVVNAAGPWIDSANQSLGAPSQYIGGTKGSHLILDKPQLHERLDGRMVYFESTDGRICLVYPYLGRVLVGSTDIPIEDPDRARCETDEIAYMLSALGEVFPDIEVDDADILYRYCGVRPLPRAAATDPGRISRDHSMPVLEAAGDRPFPIISLVGGKWTTFRAFGQEVADWVLGRLAVKRRCHTVDLPIGGGADYPADVGGFALDLARRHGVTTERAASLIDRYGAKAAAIATFCAARQDRPLAHLADFTQGEVRFLAERELVGRLGDLLYARTTLAITGRLTAGAVREVAEIVGASLGWTSTERDTQIDQFLTDLAERHGVDISAGAQRAKAPA